MVSIQICNIFRILRFTRHRVSIENLSIFNNIGLSAHSFRTGIVTINRLERMFLNYFAYFSKHEATTKSLTRNEADSTSNLNANGTKSEAVPPAKKQRTEEHSSQESSQSPNLANEIACLDIQIPTPSTPTPTVTNTPTAHKLSSSSTKSKIFPLESHA